MFSLVGGYKLRQPRIATTVDLPDYDALKLAGSQAFFSKPSSPA